MNKVSLFFFAVTGVSILWLGVTVTRHSTELNHIRLCSAGKLAAACKQALGTPNQEWDGKKNHQIWIWKSGSKFSATADMAVISKDGVIVEVLDLDIEVGKQRIRDVYFNLE